MDSLARPRPVARPRQRVLACTAVAVGVVLASPTPAEAHSRAGDSSNVDSRILVTPDLADVTWRIYDGGLYLEVRSAGSHDVEVLGYEGEPYLRIGPGGVFVNRNSPATYLNRDRYADVAVPPRADPTAVPEWQQVATGTTHAWHDHRTHWMAPTLPRDVASEPGRIHELTRWTVPFDYGGVRYEIGGDLRWVPAPGLWPRLLAGFLLAAPPLALLRRRGDAPDRLRPAAFMVLALATANLIHLPDEVLAQPVPGLDVYVGVLHTLLFVGVGIAGSWWALRGRATAVPALVAASGAVLFHQGLLHLPVLTASQIPSIWPEDLVRLLTATSLAQAVTVGVVVLAVRTAGSPSTPHAADRGVEPGRALSLR